jgi:hypothetical protein
MNPEPCPRQIAEHDVDDDETAPRPSVEALLAATLALMTGVVERAALVQPLAGHAQSQVMAVKVRSNLFFLASHPQLSEGFRLTLGRLRTHWDRLTTPTQVAADADDAMARPDAAGLPWHRAPRGLQ